MRIAAITVRIARWLHATTRNVRHTQLKTHIHNLAVHSRARRIGCNTDTRRHQFPRATTSAPLQRPALLLVSQRLEACSECPPRRDAGDGPAGVARLGGEADGGGGGGAPGCVA
jgi:hypothetical protein